jgi:hypothetical protein
MRQGNAALFAAIHDVVLAENGLKNPFPPFEDLFEVVPLFLSGLAVMEGK